MSDNQRLEQTLQHLIRSLESFGNEFGPFLTESDSEAREKVFARIDELKDSSNQDLRVELYALAGAFSIKLEEFYLMWSSEGKSVH